MHEDTGVHLLEQHNQFTCEAQLKFQCITRWLAQNYITLIICRSRSKPAKSFLENLRNKIWNFKTQFLDILEIKIKYKNESLDKTDYIIRNLILRKMAVKLSWKTVEKKNTKNIK